MLTRFDNIPASERIIVALDMDAFEAYALAEKLRGRAKWIKIGMTLLYAEGPAIVSAFKKRGFNVFVDLKLHDIPHQVAGAAASLVECGADMVTFHTVGGVPMMSAGQQAVEDRAGILNVPCPITLGVTVLTSMDAATLQATGVERPVVDQVRALASQAKEAKMLRELLGHDAAIVTPGVRPAGAALGDQSRVATPEQAFADGVSHIVIGRPITQAEDPVAAFEAIAAAVDGR